ncbi:MAG: hypothetical protein ABWZ98_18875, partial [Nakamurella sp.]
TLLVQAAGVWATRAATVEQTIVAASSIIGSEPTVGTEPDPQLNPDVTVASLPELIAQGLPTSPSTPAGGNRARLGLQVDIDAPADSSANLTPATILDHADITLTDGPAEGCLTATAAGSDPHLLLGPPGGRTGWSISTPAGGLFAISLPAAGGNDQQVGALQPGQTRSVLTSLPSSVTVKLTLAMSQSVVCGLR